MKLKTPEPTPTLAAGRSLLFDAVFNLESLAGLISLQDAFANALTVADNGETFLGGVALPTSDSRSGSSFGSVHSILWAAQVLTAERPADGASLGGVWRDAGELAGATVDFVQGFLERWRGGVLGEVTAEVLPTGGDEPRETFKAKRVRRDYFLDADGLPLLEDVKVGDKARDLLVLDVLLADMLDELGQASTAHAVRATPRGERGKRWVAQPGGQGGALLAPKACSAVFTAVWRRVEAERERARLAHGVIGRRALGALQHTVRVGLNRPELVDVGGRAPVLQVERGVKVATIPSSLVQGLTQERLDAGLRGAGLIATAGWNALVHKGVVGSSLRQWNGEQHPGLYRFAGYAGLADALGLSSPKHRLALPDMLEFGELYRFDLGDAFEPSPLWTHRVEKVSGGGQGRRLEWNVNPWVYGADVRSLPDGADKALVFLSPQPAPMVLKASPNLSAAQWSFWWQFHSSLMLCRSELFDTGAMTLDDEWWLAVAESAGWTERQKRDLLPKAIDRYTADLVDQLLERVPNKPAMFTPGRSLEGVAEGLKRQEARFRGNSKGGKNRAKKREARMVSGWKPAPKKKAQHGKGEK